MATSQGLGMQNESFILVTKRFIAWKLLNLSEKAQITLDAILYFYNPLTLTAWPTIEVLRHYTRLGKTSLHASLDELIKKGVIKKEKKKEGQHWHNIYRFLTVENGKLYPPQGIGEKAIGKLIREYYENKNFI
jgi:hypothetical protein